MTTIYDFDVDADANGVAIPDGFPPTMDFSDFNDTMREYMAKKARFLVDAGGKDSPLDLDPVTQSPSVEDGELDATSQTISSPPVGFIVMFRLTATGGNNQPLWMAIDGGAKYPLVDARGGMILRGGLHEGALYQAVFTGTRWQLISNLKGSKQERGVRNVTSDAVSLIGRDVGGVIIATKDSSSDLTITIPGALLDRWPVGATCEIVNFGHVDNYVVFDSKVSAAYSISGVDTGSGNLVSGASISAADFSIFVILRRSPLNFRVFVVPGTY